MQGFGRARAERLAHMFIVIVLGACGGSLTAPEVEPFQEGQIVEINPPSGDPKLGDRVLVKETPDEECGVVWFFTDETTLVKKDSDGSLREISFDNLEVGLRVRAWSFPGRVPPLSCPPLAEALWFEVLPD